MSKKQRSQKAITRPRIVLGLCAGAVVLFAFLVFQRTFQPKHQPSETKRQSASQQASLPRATSFPTPTHQELPTPAKLTAALPPIPLPLSLEGTDIDGSLDVDADGHFLPNLAALRLFDYFLSAAGEEPTDVILVRIRQAIQSQLSPPAIQEAEAFLATYLSYRDQAAQQWAAANAETDYAAHLAALSTLRREVFGDVLADALFGEEEAIARVTLERFRVIRDEALSETEKWEQINALEAELPETVRAQYKRATAALDARQYAQALRDAGATPQEIHAVRAGEFGEDAANRLDALDQQRQQWAARFEGYREKRDTILDDPALSPSDQAEQIQALRTDNFAPSEIKHVEALDRIDSQPGG